ncbi:MAG: hypothetical protein ACOY93_08410 [Bacillota bacterium]
MLTRFWEWILTNPDHAATIAGAVITILLGAVGALRATGSVRQALLQLMLRADRERRRGRLGPIDGPQVMERVLDWAMVVLVPRAPFWLRPFLTRERLRSWAQRLYDVSLDLLDDGLLNGTRPKPLLYDTDKAL